MLHYQSQFPSNFVAWFKLSVGHNYLIRYNKMNIRNCYSSELLHQPILTFRLRRKHTHTYKSNLSIPTFRKHNSHFSLPKSNYVVFIFFFFWNFNKRYFQMLLSSHMLMTRIAGWDCMNQSWPCKNLLTIEKKTILLVLLWSEQKNSWKLVLKVNFYSFIHYKFFYSFCNVHAVCQTIKVPFFPTDKW